MRDDMKWELLDRYFAGECTPDETREIEHGIGADQARRRQLETLRELWARAARGPDAEWDARAAWQRLAPTLETSGPGRAPRPRLAMTPAGALNIASRQPSSRMASVVRIAAAVVLVLAGVGVWQRARHDSHRPAEGMLALRDYTTTRGQRAEIELGDGTRIVLGPASSLRVPRHMDSASRRDVYLEGEALFEVTHDATRPFLVHTANGVAEDLGTRFVVTSYAADTIARVVVADGKVTIRARREMAAAADKGAPEQVLTAGDLGLLSRGGQITTTHRVALDQYFGWATGQLVFRNAPLREVATTLARWYAVDIRVSSPATAARRHVTLTTTPDQPLSEVLTALTVPLGLRAARSGDTVFISQ